MARPFYFRHFILRQDKTAMKAGTDSMLLGALAPIENTRKILDIGTGTGILALMLAQRSKAHIDAIDINDKAYEQAKENFENSMWKNRLFAYHSSAQEFVPTSNYTYDLIVSNPPFFAAHDSPKSSPASRSRKQARQTQELTFYELAEHAKRLLQPKGILTLILPVAPYRNFEKEAHIFGLRSQKLIFIKSKPESEPVRVIASFGFRDTNPLKSEFTIYDLNGSYSAEYVRLTKDFHALDLG
jgi:tRNA1Val (adenine37-N6)-methyltransferase